MTDAAFVVTTPEGRREAQETVDSVRRFWSSSNWLTQYRINEVCASLVSTPTRWWLARSNYQLVNLREALRAIVRHLSPLSVLNSGDWTGEILNVLDTVATVTDPPNRNAERMGKTVEIC